MEAMVILSLAVREGIRQTGTVTVRSRVRNLFWLLVQAHALELKRELLIGLSHLLRSEIVAVAEPAVVVQLAGSIV